MVKLTNIGNQFFKIETLFAYIISKKMSTECSYFYVDKDDTDDCEYNRNEVSLLGNFDRAVDLYADQTHVTTLKHIDISVICIGIDPYFVAGEYIKLQDDDSPEFIVRSVIDTFSENVTDTFSENVTDTFSENVTDTFSEKVSYYIKEEGNNMFLCNIATGARIALTDDITRAARPAHCKDIRLLTGECHETDKKMTVDGITFWTQYDVNIYGSNIYTCVLDDGEYVFGILLNDVGKIEFLKFDYTRD
jgi:hypothetical protein